MHNISLRDYFAAKAMQGILANWNDEKCTFHPSAVAARAYIIADKMLKERLDGNV